MSPAGDLLALAAAAVWAVYSVLTKRIAESACGIALTLIGLLLSKTGDAKVKKK